METELKLLLNHDDALALKEHALLKQHATQKPQLQQLNSTYFDTPDLYFRRHGASLRVRHIEGEGWIQTIKGDVGGVAGLHQRDEWETPLRSPLPELATLRRLVKQDPHWRKILSSRSLSKRLVPLFTTHVKRTTWMLRLQQGDNVELALDQGEVAHDKSHTAISEIELELKSGDAAHLFDFALQLQDGMTLRIDNTSKADRGFALCVPQPPEIVMASRSALSAAMTVEQAFQAIIMNCLSQIEGNATGVATGNDPESVHQMRVGLRRLHSALVQFKKVAPLPEPLQADFDWLGGELGAARDWEVLSVTTLPAVTEKFPANTELSALKTATTEIARSKRAAAAQAVASTRYTHLMLAFASWVQGARWRETLAAPQMGTLEASVQQFSDKTIRSQCRALLKKGQGINKMDTAQRHKVRIAAKKVRYATEFFAPLYANGIVKPFVQRLEALQDMLGKLNDTRVAGELLQQAGKLHPELTAVSGFVHGYLVASNEIYVPQLSSLWAKFRAVKMPVK